jgi:TolB-like protein/DNA-binding winged helix-turn-helix (wHTH) protein
MSIEPSLLSVPATAGYRLDDLLIDLGSCRVIRNGVDLPIAGLSFDLLVRLLEAGPHLLTTDAIMDGVWPGLIVTPETVTQRIKLLRQGLGDAAESPRYFVAVRGRGYRLLSAPEALAPAALAAALNRSSATNAVADVVPAVPPRRTTPGSRIRRGYIMAVALVAILGAIAYWWQARQLIPASATRVASPDAVSRNSIAVMPFANLTGEAAKAYLADGMAEELISTLSAVPGLKVSARTSSFAYAGRETDIRRIASDLGVATVLEGSVRSAGDRLRVSARLIDASQGFQIWSQTYDRDFSDLFKLQDDLATQIVQALRGQFSTAPAALAARPEPAPDLQAYQLYLQAREVSRGDPKTQQDAYELDNQAVARDQNFSTALAYRAFLQVSLVLYERLPANRLDDAQRDALHALTLRPGLAEAYAALGQISAIRGDAIEAEKYFRAGLAANPSDSWLRDVYALGLPLSTGRLKEALAQFREAYDLAPASGFAIRFLAVADTLTGHDAEARRLNALNQRLGGGGPPDWDAILLDIRAVTDADQYEALAELSVDTLPGDLRDSGGGHAIRAFFAALADPAKRSAAILALHDFEPKLIAAHIDERTKVYFINLFVMLNALDPAYDLAQRFLEQHPTTPGSGYWSNLWSPEMRAFRRDHRFQALVTRLNFIEYWKQYGPPDGCVLDEDKVVCR